MPVKKSDIAEFFFRADRKTDKTRSLGHTAAGFDCVAQYFRLMLLGSPPDMVRGILSHRTRCCMTKLKHLVFKPNGAEPL